MSLSPKVVGALALSLPGLALANGPEGSPAGAALQAIAGLAVVVALIVATAWVLKRIQPGRFAATGVLKPIAQISLGTRERVVVVEMGEKWLVLGVTASSINTLHTTDRGEATPPAAMVKAAPFAEWLARARGANAGRDTGTSHAQS